MRNVPSRLAAAMFALLIGVTSLTPALAQPAVAPAEYEAGAAEGMSSIAVVALSGYDNLLEDINYLGGLGGRPQAGQMIEGTIALFTQGKGLVGLDKSKPMGVVLQTDGSQFVPIICLPVNDLTAMLDLLVAFQIQSVDLGEGVYEITAPNQTLYAKQMGEWVACAQSEEALDSAPADPTAVLTSLVSEYDLGARVLVQNVPALYKQMAIGQLQAGLEAGLQQQPGESDEAFEKRRQISQSQVQQLIDLINDLDELTVGLMVDSVGEKSNLDVVITANDGTDLAKQFAAIQNSETNLSGFVDKRAAITMSSAMTLNAEAAAAEAERMETQLADVRSQLDIVFDQQGNLGDAERELIMGIVDAFGKSWKATILKGTIEGAMTLDISADAFMGYGATTLEEPGNVESALRDLDTQAKQKSANYPGMTWDADSHGDATFHALSIPVPAGNIQAQAMFGPELTVHVGFGPNRIYFAFEDDGLAKTKAAIDASAAAGAVTVKPMEMVVALSPILEFAKQAAPGQNGAVPAMLADALVGADGNDHLRLTVESVPSGARYRLELEQGVLKVLGAAATAAQAAQAAQPGF